MICFLFVLDNILMWTVRKYLKEKAIDYFNKLYTTVLTVKATKQSEK